MTVGTLLETFTEGRIIFVDSTTGQECGFLNAQSPIVSYIRSLDVVEWKAATSSSNPRIKVYCEFSSDEELSNE